MRIRANPPANARWQTVRLPQPFSLLLLTISLAALVPGCHPKPTVPAVAPEVAAYEQGMKLLQSGKTGEAQAAFDRAMQMNVGYAPAYLAQAQVEAKLGNTGRAIELLEMLRKAAPRTPHVTCHLAELQAAGGHFVEQWTAAQLALEQEPDCGLAITQYALALVAAGDFKAAIAKLQAVHQRFPQDERAALTLAQILAKSGKSEDAWKLLDALPAQTARRAQADYIKGWILAEYGKNGRKDDAGALQLLDRVLAETPDDNAANVEKARILLRMNDVHSAQACLQRARRATVPSAELLTTVAAVQTKLHNPAAPQMEQNARAFSTLVNKLYAARQKYIADPSRRDNRVELARMEASVGNTQDAQTLLTQVLQQNPNDAEALKLMTPQDAPSPGRKPAQPPIANRQTP